MRFEIINKKVFFLSEVLRVSVERFIYFQLNFVRKYNQKLLLIFCSATISGN